MNYELAKELKEAGFPNLGNEAPEGAEEKWSYTRFPTLSELIEACGPRFDKLYKQGSQWIAKTNLNDHSDDGVFGHGSTPEEAVSMLWLALNKKNV